MINRVRRIILNYPPVSSVWHLPVGIAYLASMLQNEGHYVIQRYSHILGLEYVLLAQDRVRVAAALQTVRDPASDIMALYQARLTFEGVSRSIPTFDKKFIVERNNVSYVSRFYDNDEYDDVQGLVEAVRQRDKQLWYDYFVRVELPLAQHEQADIYGISISDERQLVQGIVLASIIKEALPQTLVVVGGNFWSRVVLPETAQRLMPLFRFFDAIVYAEGFQPMQQLAASGDPRTTPGTVWADGDRVVVNPRSDLPMEFDQIPTPVFPADVRQWSPDPVYPLYTMSNCPMSCGFCAISAGSDTFLHHPRAMSPRRIAEHMQRLGVQRFDITDELLSIQRQIAIGQELKALDYHATWQCYLTVTSHLLNPDTCHQLYAAGCRGVQLGLESLSPDTLKREHKAWNNPRNYGRILRNLEQAGIQTHVFLIVGIPGEPLHWSLQWLPFLEEYGDSILTIKSSRYRLARRSPEEQFGRHSEFIQVRADQKVLHLNRDFEYQRNADRSIRKDVEALRDLLEQACREHWAYNVTSTLPWWINRGRYTLPQLRAMAQQLPPPDPVRHFDRVLARVRSITRAELGAEIRANSYADLVNLVSDVAMRAA